MIVSFFKKLFSRKTTNNMNTETTSTTNRKHKLEIQVFEADYDKADQNNGNPQWRPVNYGMDNGKPLIIEVADEKEFEEIRQQYAMCDQRIKVIREIDPFDDVSNAKPASTNISNSIASEPSVPQQTQAHNNSIKQPASIMSKPKIITVGDTQIKYDGEKVYSRQWVKLNSKESSCFRIVNDTNNKIFPLNGKHIEALRWVLIENDCDTESSDDISKSIESIISGN